MLSHLIRIDAILKANEYDPKYLDVFFIIYSFCWVKLEKVKGADQSDKSKMRSKERFMVSHQRVLQSCS